LFHIMLPSFVVNLNTNNTFYSQLVTQFSNIILTYLWIFYLYIIRPFYSFTCYPSLFEISFNYSYPLIAIGPLLLKLILLVRIAFWQQFIHWPLALIVISFCSNRISSVTRSLKCSHLPLHFVLSSNYFCLAISVPSCSYCSSFSFEFHVLDNFFSRRFNRLWVTHHLFPLTRLLV